MAYYCQFEPDGESVPATQVILNPDTGDTVPCCDAHLLGVCMGQITEIVGNDHLVEFMTTWLQAVMANLGLDTESPDDDTLPSKSGGADGTADGLPGTDPPSVPVSMDDTLESLWEEETTPLDNAEISEKLQPEKESNDERTAAVDEIEGTV